MEDIKFELQQFIKRNYIPDNIRTKHFKGKIDNYSYGEAEFAVSNVYFNKHSISNIDDYINQHEDYSDFQTLLFKYIDDRELKDSDVYNKVHIDRRLFSKIRSDNSYHPSKETIILLGFSLELNEEELTNLLDSASYSLPKNNVYDLIIRFCFIKGIYNINDVNELLDSYNCKLFNY